MPKRRLPSKRYARAKRPFFAFDPRDILPSPFATQFFQFLLPELTTRETKNLCETTRGVKSYSGYVHLPAGSQYAPYDQNIFFWFFEARQNPKHAPLTVWLQGGPGMGSTAEVSAFRPPYIFHYYSFHYRPLPVAG